MNRRAPGPAIVVMGLLLLGLWPGAAGAVAARRVVDCRRGKPVCWPTAFDLAPRRKVFYVERFTGHVRVYNRRTDRDRRWKRIRHVATAGEQGLLGLTLDDRWKRGRRFRWVYVYLTHDAPLQNRVMRYRKKRGGGFRRQILARIPAAGNHNGGVLHIGPDGRLWAVTGDAGTRSNAQSFANLAGKVLRMTKKGGLPDDNPVLGDSRRRIWSYGHRNSFGFTFDPETDDPWQTENGPTCNDELNHPGKGENRGWGPNESCPNTNNSGPSPVGPEHLINPVTAPTGAAFCNGCGLGVEGRLLYASFNDQDIRSATLSAGRDNVTGTAHLFQHVRPVLGLLRGGGGSIYFSDDRGIYRLDP